MSAESFPRLLLLAQYVPGFSFTTPRALWKGGGVPTVYLRYATAITPNEYLTERIQSSKLEFFPSSGLLRRVKWFLGQLDP